MKLTGRACTTFLSVVDCSANHGLSEVCTTLPHNNCQTHTFVGSGSTYVYGYCDATYQEGWGRDETVNFVKNSKYKPSFDVLLVNQYVKSALALAMSRDGSSGGVIRMCVITEDKVERLFVPGNELPRFWEGHEILGAAELRKKVASDIVPMVEA